MDENDPAWKLAEAALAVVRGDLEALDKAFTELKPTTRTLSRAYGLCLTTHPFSGTEATRLLLNTLQYSIAEKSAHQLTVLTRWVVALTVLIALLGLVDVALRICGGR